MRETGSCARRVTPRRGGPDTMPVCPSVVRRTRMRLSALGVDGVKRLALPGDHGVEPPLPPRAERPEPPSVRARYPGASPRKAQPPAAHHLFPTVSRYLAGV